MSLDLLTQASNNVWAILPHSLEAIFDIIQNHDLVFPTSTFHQNEGDMQANIGLIGEPDSNSYYTNLYGSVGILHIDGPVIPRSVNAPSCGPTPSIEIFTRELKALEENSEITSIVICYDTPGGLVTGVQELGELISSLETPVYSYVYGYAASAGYWLASQGKEIIMNPTAQVGSIGTAVVFTDRSEADAKEGIKKFDIVSNLSKKKRLDPMQGEGKENLLEMLDDITNLFIENVASGRNTTPENVLETFGQGKMFIASKAIDLGMADKVGSLDALVKDLNTKQTNTNPEVISMDIKTMSADGLKQENPTLFDSIVKIGAQKERERIQSLETMIEKDPSAASFINKEKYDPEMNESKMALAIFNSREEIKEDALTTIAKNGKALTEASEKIATNTTKPSTSSADDEDEDDFDEDLAKEAAQQEHNKQYGIANGGM